MTLPLNQITKWSGCYEGGWNGLIVPDAFSHPAKMAYGLVNRIYDHAFEQGWLKEGDVCADPFGGVGTTAIIGAYRNVQVVCCELEEKFCTLARENFELHRRKWEGLDCPQPVIIQGDSREMCTVLGAADCIISSPPFQESLGDAANAPYTKLIRPNLPAANDVARYLKDKRDAVGLSRADVDRALGTVTLYSWYEGRPAGTQIPTPEHWLILKQLLELDTRFDAQILTTRKVEATSRNTTEKTGHSKIDSYGHTPGQLGSMKPGDVDAIVSSPPYAGSMEHAGDIDATQSEHKGGPHSQMNRSNTTYGSSPGQLGSMKPGDVDAIVSSPPYEGCSCESTLGKGKPTRRTGDGAGRNKGDYHYGDTAGNIGNDKGPTFWVAAKEIVQQCHQILKPGGHAIWVVKSFIRKGRRVDFPGDWRRLCESVGFTTVCTHHAMLVKETTEDGLFGEMTTKKERKSFFRRLAESKGSPVIDYEVILCMEK